MTIPTWDSLQLVSEPTILGTDSAYHCYHHPHQATTIPRIYVHESLSLYETQGWSRDQHTITDHSYAYDHPYYSYVHYSNPHHYYRAELSSKPNPYGFEYISSVVGVFQKSLHKRRATGGKKKAWRKKGKYELGRRQPARVRTVRLRSDNVNWRSLRLDTGSYTCGDELVYCKTHILDVVSNSSNNTEGEDVADVTEVDDLITGNAYPKYLEVSDDQLFEDIPLKDDIGLFEALQSVEIEVKEEGESVEDQVFDKSPQRAIKISHEILVPECDAVINDSNLIGILKPDSDWDRIYELVCIEYEAHLAHIRGHGELLAYEDEESSETDEDQMLEEMPERNANAFMELSPLSCVIDINNLDDGAPSRIREQVFEECPFEEPGADTEYPDEGDEAVEELNLSFQHNQVPNSDFCLSSLVSVGDSLKKFVMDGVFEGYHKFNQTLVIFAPIDFIYSVSFIKLPQIENPPAKLVKQVLDQSPQRKQRILHNVFKKTEAFILDTHNFCNDSNLSDTLEELGKKTIMQPSYCCGQSVKSLAITDRFESGRFNGRFVEDIYNCILLDTGQKTMMVTNIDRKRFGAEQENEILPTSFFYLVCSYSSSSNGVLILRNHFENLFLAFYSSYSVIILLNSPFCSPHITPFLYLLISLLIYLSAFLFPCISLLPSPLSTSVIIIVLSYIITMFSRMMFRIELPLNNNIIVQFLRFVALYFISNSSVARASIMNLIVEELEVDSVKEILTSWFSICAFIWPFSIQNCLGFGRSKLVMSYGASLLNNCLNLADQIVLSLERLPKEALEMLTLQGCRKIAHASLVESTHNCPLRNFLDVPECGTADCHFAILSCEVQVNLQEGLIEYDRHLLEVKEPLKLFSPLMIYFVDLWSLLLIVYEFYGEGQSCTNTLCQKAFEGQLDFSRGVRALKFVFVLVYGAMYYENFERQMEKILVIIPDLGNRDTGVISCAAKTSVCKVKVQQWHLNILAWSLEPLSKEMACLAWQVVHQSCEIKIIQLCSNTPIMLSAGKIFDQICRQNDAHEFLISTLKEEKANSHDPNSVVFDFSDTSPMPSLSTFCILYMPLKFLAGESVYFKLYEQVVAFCGIINSCKPCEWKLFNIWLKFSRSILQGTSRRLFNVREVASNDIHLGEVQRLLRNDTHEFSGATCYSKDTLLVHLVKSHLKILRCCNSLLVQKMLQCIHFYHRHLVNIFHYNLEDKVDFKEGGMLRFGVKVQKGSRCRA